MIVLGLDTSESLTSISIIRNNEFLASFNINEKKKTAAMLIPYIDYILKELEIKLSDIDLIAVCSGPGSYTSLRIGYSTVKTLAIVNNIPMTEISRFRIIAQSFINNYVEINSNKKLSVILPTTYKKVSYQNFSLKYSNEAQIYYIIQLSEAEIISVEDYVNNYNNNDYILIGKFLGHKKMDDLKDICNLDNYIEYIETGSSSTYAAKMGLELYKNGYASNPYDAEPLYLHSPF